MVDFENEFNSANYITLKQFQGGWIWIKNIKETTSRILPLLEKLSVKEIQKIADILNGAVMPWHIFDDTEWVLRLSPLPGFIILYIFNNDEEFGSALKIFFHKSSIKVPTEDAYVWTQYFLDFLGIFAKGGTEKAISTQYQDELISFHELLEEIDPINKKKMWNDIIGQREAPLLKINQKTAEQISIQLKVSFFTGNWEEIQIQWGFKFELLKSFNIYIVLSIDGTKVNIYYTKNVLNFQSRRILFFTWLYCNAIIREARLIMGDTLPKLSEYL
ncbi:MAG: DUF3786 domain-containing protein [Candidatus Helarchaeota archaeon]|nr:DUF3786 domain-containing protein [Candidatus Helarchaeota archaeon]